MSLDFAAKHGIIERVGNPANWQNIFDAAFFEDKRRKWSSKSHGDITVSFNKNYDEERETEIEKAKKEGREPDLSEKRAVIITYLDRKKDVRSELIIEESDIGFMITDERGVSVSSATPYSEMTPLQDDKPPAMKSANDAGVKFPHRALIDHLGIIVEFSNKGQKRITFERSNSFIELEGSNAPAPDDLKTGRFFNVVNLDGAFLEELARTKKSPMTFVMLVAAKDLGLQPNLRSFNGFRDDAAAKAATALAGISDDDIWVGSTLKRLGGISALEKAWNDTAEFNGYRAEIPKNFMASEQTGGGINIQTTSTGKERVLTRGHLLSAAMNDGTQRHGLNSGGLVTVFKQLADTQVIEDRGNNPWHLITIEHKGNLDGIRALMVSARTDYLLTADEFALINISETMAMVAISQDALEKCLTAKPMSGFALEKEVQPAPSNVVALRPRN